MSLAALVVAAATLPWHRPARAAGDDPAPVTRPRGDVAVLGRVAPGVDPGRVATVVGQIAGALRAAGVAEVLNEEQARRRLLGGAVEEDPAARLAPVVEVVAAATTQVGRGDLTGAAARFAEAEETLLTGVADSPQRWQLLADVRAARAGVHVTAGEHDAALALYRRLVAVHEGADLDRWAHAPAERALIAQAREHPVEGAGGTLAVAVVDEAPGLRLVIDGRERGPAPTVVPRLPPGRYHLRVVDAEGRAGFGHVVQVEDGHVTHLAVDAALETRLVVWQGPSVIDAPDVVLARVVARLACDAVLFAGVAGARVHLAVGGVRGELDLTTAGELPPGASEAIGALVATGQRRAPVAIPADELAAIEAAALAARPWYANPWLWGGVAVVALAGVTTAVVLATRRTEHRLRVIVER